MLRAAKRKGHSLTMTEVSKLLKSGKLKEDGTLLRSRKRKRVKTPRRSPKKSTKKSTKRSKRSKRPTVERDLSELELHPKVVSSLRKLCKLKGK